MLFIFLPCPTSSSRAHEIRSCVKAGNRKKSWEGNNNRVSSHVNLIAFGCPGKWPERVFMMDVYYRLI